MVELQSPHLRMPLSRWTWSSLGVRPTIFRRGLQRPRAALASAHTFSVVSGSCTPGVELVAVPHQALVDGVLHHALDGVVAEPVASDLPLLAVGAADGADLGAVAEGGEFPADLAQAAVGDDQGEDRFDDLLLLGVGDGKLVAAHAIVPEGDPAAVPLALLCAGLRLGSLALHGQLPLVLREAEADDGLAAIGCSLDDRVEFRFELRPRMLARREDLPVEPTDLVTEFRVDTGTVGRAFLPARGCGGQECPPHCSRVSAKRSRRWRARPRGCVCEPDE